MLTFELVKNLLEQGERPNPLLVLDSHRMRHGLPATKAIIENWIHGYRGRLESAKRPMLPMGDQTEVLSPAAFWASLDLSELLALHRWAEQDPMYEPNLPVLSAAFVLLESCKPRPGLTADWLRTLAEVVAACRAESARIEEEVSLYTGLETHPLHAAAIHNLRRARDRHLSEVVGALETLEPTFRTALNEGVRSVVLEAGVEALVSDLQNLELVQPDSEASMCEREAALVTSQLETLGDDTGRMADDLRAKRAAWQSRASEIRTARLKATKAKAIDLVDGVLKGELAALDQLTGIVQAQAKMFTPGLGEQLASAPIVAARRATRPASPATPETNPPIRRRRAG